jgi:hypothetical protein
VSSERCTSTSSVPATVAAGCPAAGRSTLIRAVGAVTPETSVSALGRVWSSSQTDAGALAGTFDQTQLRIL